MLVHFMHIAKDSYKWGGIVVTATDVRAILGKHSGEGLDNATHVSSTYFVSS